MSCNVAEKLDFRVRGSGLKTNEACADRNGVPRGFCFSE
jgi:hypothetical protein